MRFHAGLLSFRPTVRLRDVTAAARVLAKFPDFRCVWVRRVGEDMWGIEFLSNCNDECRQYNISGEMQAWTLRLQDIVPNDMIGGLDVSGEVVVVKLPCQQSGHR